MKLGLDNLVMGTCELSRPGHQLKELCISDVTGKAIFADPTDITKYSRCFAMR